MSCVLGAGDADAGWGRPGGAGADCLRVAAACEGPMAVQVRRKGSGATAHGAAGAYLRGGCCMLLLCPKIFSACGGPQHDTPTVQCGRGFQCDGTCCCCFFADTPNTPRISIALSPCRACALVHCRALVGMYVHCWLPMLCYAHMRRVKPTSRELLSGQRQSPRKYPPSALSGHTRGSAPQVPPAAPETLGFAGVPLGVACLCVEPTRSAG